MSLTERAYLASEPSSRGADTSSAKIAYILGYGRSGSTVLDLLLGSLPRCTSVGEVCHFYEWATKNRSCACGKGLRECDHWREVLTSHQDSGGGSTRLLRSVEGLSVFWRLLWGTPSSRRYREYKTSVESLFESIARHRDVDFIVDSSKSTRGTVGRFLALQKLTKFDVKGIFLVRDGRGVMWSEMKQAGSPENKRRSRSRFLNAIRCAVSWTATNLLSVVAQSAAARGSVIMVRYEDLCRNPGQTIGRITEFLAIPIDQAKIGPGFRIEAGHIIAGNRLRFSQQLHLKPDIEWMSKMPRFYQRLFWIITFPVARRLGYSPGATPAAP